MGAPRASILFTIPAPEAGDATPVIVPAGGPAQVRQLFPVEALDATDAATGVRAPVLLAESMLSRPSSALYVLLDTDGRIGDARVQMGRTRGWDKSADTPPLHVELQWLAPPLRDARRSLHVVAVGPLERSRVAGGGSRRRRGGRCRGLSGAVDPARRGAPPHTMSWDVQAETWLRASPLSSWQKVESCAWVDETLVGP